jgi:hypothetical protein
MIAPETNVATTKKKKKNQKSTYNSLDDLYLKKTVDFLTLLKNPI